MFLRTLIVIFLWAVSTQALTFEAGDGVVGKPYDVVAQFEQVAISHPNLTSLAARQATGRCYTASGERYDCANPGVDACCNGQAQQGCCEGPQKRCIVPANGRGFCCWDEATECGTTCCLSGWTCCGSESSTCCSDSYGTCCGGVCCENRRQCCGGTCCNLGFECGPSRGSCVRKTTPVVTVTSTRVVTAGSTNVARRNGVGGAGKVVEVLGAVVAAVGIL